MQQKLRRAAVAIGLVVALGGTTAAVGGETDRGRYHLGTTSKAPGTSTGLRFFVGYRNPDDPRAKPPPIENAVFRLPKGMRINTAALPRCTATDAEIRAMGRGACLPSTRVGGGHLVARTGTPGADRIEADIVAYNGAGEVVEVVFFDGTNTVAGIDRLEVDRNVLTAHPPATPGGPPDGRTAVRRISLEIRDRNGDGGRAYVRNPSRCRAGIWRSRAHYEFADGGETTVPSRTRCHSR